MAAAAASAPGAPVAGSLRELRRVSVTALMSMAQQQQQDDVEDDLSKAQKRLKLLKTKISTQSKKNFVLERDVRYLDSRIALLIQHRSALDAEQELANSLEEAELTTGSIPDERKRQNYGNLFFILQTEPKYIASLTRVVNMAEIDTLLQTVMFTLYGNQYESREEHLLLSVFQMVLAAQFDEIKDNEMGTLMRANTPVSRMMTTYTRRGPGQSYLKTCVADCINKVIQANENLEINPLKVYEQMINDIEVETGATCMLPRTVTAEDAALNEKVQELIAPRLARLRDWAGVFLDTIIASLNTVPYGIRWICKQIRTLTKQKFTDANDYAVASLIGAFFMLRFLNPAIVTPQAYMLVDQPPSPFARRSITLIAKMLQNLTNKPNYAKESFMLPLNNFVEDNKHRINKFFYDLCEVGDFYEQLEIDQYIALTKKDLSLNITLNEIYNTQELLLRYMDQLMPNEDDHVRVILAELGPAPKQLPRGENKPIQLPLFSRWETPINEDLSKTLQGKRETPMDVLYQETKALLVQLLRSIPPMKTRPLSLQAVVDAAVNMRTNPTVVKRGQKTQENFRKLEAEGMISAADNYAALTAEVAQELMDLERVREKVHQELESLEAVNQTIKDHNNYLRSQLESYRAYLQNVRMQSGGNTVRSSGNKKGPQFLGPFKFTHSQLEKDGVIVESDVPENRRNNIFFNFMSPLPGSFVIALHYKGRDKAILELDLKLDDLLEKQQVNDQTLDLEYVQFNVNKMLHLLNKTFLKH